MLDNFSKRNLFHAIFECSTLRMKDKVDFEVQRIVEKLQGQKGSPSPVAFQHTFIENTIYMYMLVDSSVSIPFRQFPVYQSDLREKRRAN